MNKIDEELRGQRKKIWLEQIKESKFSIGLVLVIVVILSWNIFKSADRLVETQSIYGTLIGIHQLQTDFGSSARMSIEDIDAMWSKNSSVLRYQHLNI